MTTKLQSGTPHCSQAYSGTLNCYQAEKQLTTKLESGTPNCKIAICFSDRLIAIWLSSGTKLQSGTAFQIKMACSFELKAAVYFYQKSKDKRGGGQKLTHRCKDRVFVLQQGSIEIMIARG